MFIMSVMLSPFKRIRPSAFRVFFLIESSSASSNTTFMYSSNPCRTKGSVRELHKLTWRACADGHSPKRAHGARASCRGSMGHMSGRQRTMILPSILRSVFSISQICTRVFCAAHETHSVG